MSKVIITGATGFLGSSLVRKCLEHGDDVYAVVRPESSRLNRMPQNYESLHMIPLSMESYAEIDKHLNNADYFFHIAWDGIRVPFRNNELIQLKNYYASLDAYYAAIRLGCKSFVGIGSQAEYGVVSGVMDEDSICLNPICEYGKKKLHTYKTLLSNSKDVEMSFKWGRIFSLFGPNDDPSTLISQLIKKMMKNEPVELTNCIQKWNYLFVDDAALALIALANSDCDNGAYNIASTQSRILKSYILEVKEILDSRSELFFGAINYPETGIVNLQPIVEKILKVTDWLPRVSFRDGIQEYLNREYLLIQ